MAREMLCFTIETAVVRRKGRICEMAVADLARAMLVPRSFGSAVKRWFRVCAVEINVRIIIGECSCGLLDAL